VCESGPNGVFCTDMAPYGFRVWKGIRSKKVNTCRDIRSESWVFPKNQVDFRQKTRDGLTFFDRLHFHIRHPYGAISVHKTPFGPDSHTPRKHRLGLRLGRHFRPQNVSQSGNVQWHGWSPGCAHGCGSNGIEMGLTQKKIQGSFVTRPVPLCV
jgi:hypothetical protein